MFAEKLKNLNFLSLCFLTCFPILGMKVTVVAIIIFTSLSVITAFVSPSQVHRPAIKDLIILLLPFLLIFLRTFILDRSDDAKFYLEVSLSLLAFPLAFFLSTANYSNKQRDVLCIIFVVATLLVVCYGQAIVALRLLEHLGPDKFWKTTSDMINDPSFAYHIRTVFEQTVNIHPTHACIFLGISFLIVFEKFLKSYRVLGHRQKNLLIVLLALILILQVNLASRTPFIATMAASLLMYFMFLRKKMHALYALGAIILVSTILVIIVPSFSARFREISFSNTALPTEQHENSFNLRTGIYKCSVEIIQTNWLWGVGPANVQPRLNECYSKISKEVYDDKNYNTHNQFMDYWAGMGIAGPVLLLAVLLFVSWKNIRSRNPIALGIVLLFLISLLTENLLTRQNGIVPFAYFMSMMVFLGRGRPDAVGRRP